MLGLERWIRDFFESLCACVCFLHIAPESWILLTYVQYPTFLMRVGKITQYSFTPSPRSGTARSSQTPYRLTNGVQDPRKLAQTFGVSPRTAYAKA